MSESESDQPRGEESMSSETPPPHHKQMQRDEESQSHVGASDNDEALEDEQMLEEDEELEGEEQDDEAEADDDGEEDDEELEDEGEEQDDEEEFEDEEDSEDDEELEDEDEEQDGEDEEQDEEEEFEDEEDSEDDDDLEDEDEEDEEQDGDEEEQDEEEEFEEDEDSEDEELEEDDEGKLEDEEGDEVEDDEEQDDVEELNAEDDVEEDDVEEEAGAEDEATLQLDPMQSSTESCVADDPSTPTDIAEQYSITATAWSVRELTGGLVRKDAAGNDMVDALAGRTSVLGFDCPEVSDAIQSAAGMYLGDASAFDVVSSHQTETELLELITDIFGSTAGDLTHSMILSPSADLAVEAAIMLARRYRPQRAFRTVALVGSDHGRTMLCRTASGRPELQEDLGPLVAGFSHVPVGDLDALDVAVDDQTACVLISPNLWNCGGEVLDADYLQGVRRLCDERGVLLAVDETQVVFGSTGLPMAVSSIAQVRPDLAVFSSGLFGGLPGGITLASERVTGGQGGAAAGYPLLASVLSATLSAIQQRGLLDQVASIADAFAIELAERVSRFEFVRDIQVLGLSIGLETDLESELLVRAAQQRQLRLDVAGDTAVRIQLPLLLTDEDRRLVVELIEATMSSIQLSTADLSV